MGKVKQVQIQQKWHLDNLHVPPRAVAPAHSYIYAFWQLPGRQEIDFICWKNRQKDLCVVAQWLC